MYRLFPVFTQGVIWYLTMFFLLSGVAKSCSLPFRQAGTLNESIHFAKIRLYVLVV